MFSMQLVRFSLNLPGHRRSAGTVHGGWLVALLEEHGSASALVLPGRGFAILRALETSRVPVALFVEIHGTR